MQTTGKSNLKFLFILISMLFWGGPYSGSVRVVRGPVREAVRGPSP